MFARLRPCARGTRTARTRRRQPSRLLGLSLLIGGATTSGCLLYTNGTWTTGTTTFVDGDTPANASCWLTPGFVAGSTSFRVAGEGTPTADGDAVRHSLGTAEDEIVAGSFVLRVYPRDRLNAAAQLVWQATSSCGFTMRRGGA